MSVAIQAVCYYDYINAVDSDEELPFLQSDADAQAGSDREDTKSHPTSNSKQKAMLDCDSDRD